MVLEVSCSEAGAIRLVAVYHRFERNATLTRAEMNPDKLVGGLAVWYLEKQDQTVHPASWTNG